MLRTIGSVNSTVGAGGVIKTVILPNEEINKLGIEAEELRQLFHA